MAKNFSLKVGIEAIDKVSAPLMKINSTIKAASKSMTRARSVGIMPKTHEAMISISKSMKGLGKATGIPKIIDQINGIGGAAIKAGGALKTMALTLSGSGLVVGGVGFGVASIMNSMTKEGTQLQDASDKLGISTIQLQKYQFAAASAGVSNESLEASFEALSHSAIQAAMGGGEASQVFEALGVRVMDSTGKKIKRVDQLFLEASESLSKLNNMPLKRELMSKIMGGTGAMSLVNQGKKGIKSSLNTADKFNFIDQPQIDQTSKWTASLATLSYTLKGIRNIIGVELLPVITDTFGKFSDYLRENQGEIRAFFKDLAASLPAAMTSIKQGAQTLIEALSPLISFLKGVHESIGLVNVALIALAAIVMSNPLGLLVVVLSRVAAVAQFLMVKLEKLGDVFAGIFKGSSVLDKVERIGAIVGTLGKSVISTEWADKGLTEFMDSKKTQAPSQAFTPVPAINVKREPMALKAPSNKPNINGKKEEQDSQVTVRFENAPAGMRVTQSKGPVDIDVYRGFAMAGAQ